MNFDFPIEIIRTERSKSASIEIEDDTVKVTVPQNLSDLRIEELIRNRRRINRRMMHQFSLS